MLVKAGVNCTLLTDERAVLEHPLAIEFDNCVQIDPPWQSQMAAEGAYKETHLARCFLQIVDWVQTAKRPFFLWCTWPAWARPGTPGGVPRTLLGWKRSTLADHGRRA